MTIAYIFPTYNESLTFPKTLSELLPHLLPGDVVIVADDSNSLERNALANLVMNLEKVVMLPGDEKGGRGAAVRRSFEWISRNHPEVTHIIEADCDGSHRVIDIVKLAKVDPGEAFVIGSRYLESSQILGWTFPRKMLSRLLNLFIPFWLHLEISDITNGLRRYSRDAVQILLAKPISNKGFIYLSEQALILGEGGISAIEIPIVFESRFAGKSSVTLRDLVVSLKGIWQIHKMKSLHKGIN